MTITIGIDPDLKKSGVCILDNGKIVALDSMKIDDLLFTISTYPSATIAIEDVMKNKATFNRGNKLALPVKLNIAQKVGMVKGAASLICELIESYTFNKPLLAPLGLGKQFKNDAKLFNQISGYTKKTNEDKRDAWAIAKWAEIQTTGQTTSRK